MFLEGFFEKVNFEKSQQATKKNNEKLPSMQRFNYSTRSVGKMEVIFWSSIKWASTQQNLSSGFLKKRDSNQSLQLQRLARNFKFRL